MDNPEPLQGSEGGTGEGGGAAPAEPSGWRLAARVIGGGLLLISGVMGLYNGPGDVLRSTAVVERFVEALVVVYGVFGTVGGVGIWLGRPWGVWSAWAWAAIATMVGGLAPIAFGRAPVPWVEVVASTVGSGAVAVAVVVLARAGLRTGGPPEREPAGAAGGPPGSTPGS